MVCYNLVFCALLCWCICLFCVLRVCELFGEIIRNVFGCGFYFVAECYGCVGGVASIGFVCVFVCRKLSPHLRV